jgi:hypothetical protein
MTTSRERWQVFVSYAHSSGGDWARALHRVLEDAGVRVFLDTHHESAGESVSGQVFEALLGSCVIVIFADTTYFTRRYCAEELSAALAGYRALAQSDAGRDELEEALQPVVVALPAKGEPLADLDLLPPEMRNKNWPVADETQGLADLVLERLERVEMTHGERLAALGALMDLRAQLAESIAIPVPKQLAGIPLYHEIGMPPSIGEGFVGRARELWELHEALAVRQGGAAQLTAALEGGGGFGKTRLALEYLHRYAPLEYPGGVFWLNADVPDDRLEAQQYGILTVLRPNLPDLAAFRESGRDVAQELGRALSQRSESGRILYVVDNVPEPQGDRLPEPLRRWCPAVGQVSLLLTSRSRLTLVAGARRVVVRELPTSAALLLLLLNYEDRSALDEASWRRVVSWVGEWPLALELLNASLQAGAVSPGELLEAAAGAGPTRELDRQMAAVRGAVAEGTLRGVAQALRLSYQRLPHAGGRAARQLAMLAPNPIPVRLVAGVEPRLRVQLRVRSIVSGVRSGQVEMYGRMHRVLADFLRGEVEDWQQEAQEVCDSLLAVFTWEAAEDPAAWPLMNACRPHVEAVIERHGRDPGGVELAVRLIELCRVMGRLLRHLGHPTNAVQPVEFAVSLARRWLGDEHLTTLLTMGNLAWTLRVDGQLPRALELQERVVGERRRLQGDEHPDSLWAMGNLAMMLFDNGEHGRARSLQEQVLLIGRNTENQEHPATIWAMASLALTLRDLGELERAQQLQEDVVRARLRMWGGDHSHTLWAMTSLSQTLRTRGDLKRAMALQEQVLETKLRLLSEAHLDTPQAMVEVARTMRAMGQVSGAIELMERVVAIRVRLLGEEHRETELARRELDELRTRKRTQ